MMKKLFELQKANFEKRIQEMKDQTSDALGSLGPDVDVLKERTKAIEEASANIHQKRRTQSSCRCTGEQNGGSDAKI